MLRRMVTHVVCFKFDRLDIAAEVRDRLLSMRGRIPSLKAIEAGVDQIRAERSYDLALIARFDDLSGLQAYQDHPVHQEVLAYIRQVARAVVAVDFGTGR